MFKAARWRSDKNKIKAVFEFQFKATGVPQLGWETMVVSLVPFDVGRPTARSEKAAVVDGACHWEKPVTETVMLTQDLKSGKISENAYKFIVSATGSIKAGVLGETTINLADYAEVVKPSLISFPLRPPTSGAILHVTLKRLQSNLQGREADENSDRIQRQHRTLRSQFSNSEDESKVPNGTNNFTENRALINSQELRSGSSRTLLPHADSNGNLRKSSSSGTISALGSDGSSGRYTLKEDEIKTNYSHQGFTSLLSTLSNSDMPPNQISSFPDSVKEYRDHKELNTGWFESSASDGSMGRSTNSSDENRWRERLQDPDITIEKLRDDAVALARQVEMSKLELQTLRKQVVKESRRGQDFLRELSSLKLERDALKRECEELKTSQKKPREDFASVMLKLDGENSWSLLEEIRQELNHEKNLNSNLRLQLQKTQEANSELILAVRDLDELLDQKDRATSGCITMAVKPETSIVDQFICLKTSEQKESFEMISEHNDDELEVLVKDHSDVRVGFSDKQQILSLKSEVELYRKDREDLEMQMEQIALEYEIIKQENHDISSKLEQAQLRERLQMQYECSAHLTIISDLEAHVERLEKELAKQAKAFEADIETITQAKVEQEQRAIQAEEALRMAKWKNTNKVEQLQEELKNLSAQISATFYANEKLAMQAITEASELRLEKYHLEEILAKNNEDHGSAQAQYKMNLQELLSLIDIKTKEIDKLTVEFKIKSEELENQKKSDEAREKVFLEEMQKLRAEVEKLSREKHSLSEQIKQKESLLAEIEKLKTQIKEKEKLLQERNIGKTTLKTELASLQEEASTSKEELNDLRHLKNDKEETIKILSYEIEALKMQNSKLKNFLYDGKIEEEKLRSQVILLKCEHQKDDSIVPTIGKQYKDRTKSYAVTVGTTETASKNKTNAPKSSPKSAKEFSTLNENFKLLEENPLDRHKGNAPLVESCSSVKGDQFGATCLQEVNDCMGNIKEANAIDFQYTKNSLVPSKGDKECMHDPNDIGTVLKISPNKDHTEKDEWRSDSCTSDLSNIAEVISEMAVLKEQNDSMEAELKDMQQRYSEISLKFAEVEGERQQLVMTIRTLKNAMR